ncbi:MAG TPA: hypothetical protein VG387_05975 [Rhizomicrobium sp.]|jgi:hypothetical protein|nr:hypothetical protein [Rhizomicrobium sp.]
MIIHDFHAARADHTIVPAKADAPLSIDPDTPLTGAVSLELFKPVPGKIRHIGQTCRHTKPIQHALRPLSEGLELPDFSPPANRFVCAFAKLRIMLDFDAMYALRQA